MSRAPFQIVPALPGDARELARLEAACFAHPRSEAALLEELRQPERYLLVTAKREGTLLGYAGLEHVLDEGYLTDVAVFPEHRRQGLARGLLRALAARGKETLGLSFLTLEVRPGNLAAVELYRAEGYQEVGRRKNFYSDPREDALLMTKYL